MAVAIARSLPQPHVFDKKFYNMALNLTKPLQTPEVDEPMVASSLATLTEAEDVLRLEEGNWS